VVWARSRIDAETDDHLVQKGRIGERCAGSAEVFRCVKDELEDAAGKGIDGEQRVGSAAVAIGGCGAYELAPVLRDAEEKGSTKAKRLSPHANEL